MLQISSIQGGSTLLEDEFVVSVLDWSSLKLIEKHMQPWDIRHSVTGAECYIINLRVCHWYYGLSCSSWKLHVAFGFELMNWLEL
jgi:hypothetical protein